MVHDWLPTIGGAERVVMELISAFPNSELYTLFDFLTDEERRMVTGGRPVHVSGLNKLPGVAKYYRYLLLQCSRAIENFDVMAYDAVISSSAALAKGVLTAPGQPHIAYVHSPARYAWDLTHDYINSLSNQLSRHLAQRMMHKFRIWDMRTVAQVDQFVANSNFIRDRIWKAYRREAEVIYPPVDISAFVPGEGPREEYYFTASRMVPYKRIEMIAAAFRERPKLRLMIAGDGPEMARVRAAAGPNVTLLGHVTFEALRSHMQKARAFVFAAREDFGIVPVEAQAAGCPVIALGSGGTAETIRDLSMDRPTGAWFETQTVESLLSAIDKLEANYEVVTPENCRDNALRFSAERFRSEIRDCVARVSG
ncbi:glycosyltransferase [Pseudoroseicyclus tamaricis]|nr:glycosyltransferase [Pseudoroseicyclus tamaricis]